MKVDLEIRDEGDESWRDPASRYRLVLKTELPNKRVIQFQTEISAGSPERVLAELRDVIDWADRVRRA